MASAVKDYAAIERRVDAASLDLSMTAEAWANVARTGNYAKPHVHPNSNVSGVYYVDAGDAPADEQNSGVLELLDPRHRPGTFESAGTLPFDSYRIVYRESRGPRKGQPRVEARRRISALGALIWRGLCAARAGRA